METAFFETIEGLEYYALAVAFALARMIGMMSIMPLFTRMRLTGMLRSGAAIALSVPIIPAIASMLPQMEPVPTFLLLVIMLKEVLIGLVLGLVLGIPFWAAETAGDIVDLQRGASMGVLLDPMMSHETSPTGTLLAVIMLAIFLAAGGLELVLTVQYRSYELWPLDQFAPTFSADAADLLLEVLDRVFGMALILAFPLIVGLL
jgi:type III secretion protein T